MGDYSYCGDWGVMTVRGAKSCDKHLRYIGIDWFDNEELSYAEWNSVFDLYAEKKPNIMITHDCPADVRSIVWGINDKSITSSAFNGLLGIHKPKLWVFGHHHKSIDMEIDGVRYVCLAELETFILDAKKV
jgi:hypothetical protein